jgi:hypothetical protein
VRFFVSFLFLFCSVELKGAKKGSKREVQATNNGNKLNKLAKNHFLKVFCPRETRDNRLLLSYFFPSSFELRSACNQISTIQFHKLIFASRKGRPENVFSRKTTKATRRAREEGDEPERKIV